MTTNIGSDQSNLDRDVESIIRASRALVAIAARSLARAGDVTLPQYRALVAVAGEGQLTVSALARELGVHVSTVTRLVDRLVDRDLVLRSRSIRSGREVDIRLTARGRRLLRTVTHAREREVASVIRVLSAGERRDLVRALDRFSDAAGERFDREWKLGW